MQDSWEQSLESFSENPRRDITKTNSKEPTAIDAQRIKLISEFIQKIQNRMHEENIDRSDTYKNKFLMTWILHELHDIKKNHPEYLLIHSLYKALKQNRLSSGCAEFYISWAEFESNQGRNDKAKSVLLMGITEQAVPLMYLKQVFIGFTKTNQIDDSLKENLDSSMANYGMELSKRTPLEEKKPSHVHNLNARQNVISDLYGQASKSNVKTTKKESAWWGQMENKTEDEELFRPLNLTSSNHEIQKYSLAQAQSNILSESNQMKKLQSPSIIETPQLKSLTQEAALPLCGVSAFINEAPSLGNQSNLKINARLKMPRSTRLGRPVKLNSLHSNDKNFNEEDIRDSFYKENQEKAYDQSHSFSVDDSFDSFLVEETDKLQIDRADKIPNEIISFDFLPRIRKQDATKESLQIPLLTCQKKQNVHDLQFPTLPKDEISLEETTLTRAQQSKSSFETILNHENEYPSQQDITISSKEPRQTAELEINRQEYLKQLNIAMNCELDEGTITAKEAVSPETSKKQTEKHQVNVGDDKHTLSINGKMYKKIQLIGRGGSSKVYQVLHDSKLYALKKVKCKGLDSVTMQGYKNEINLLQSFQTDKEGESNEWIVKLIDWFEDEVNHVLYMVMEYGETDLANVLNKIEEKRKRHIMKYHAKLKAETSLRGENLVSSRNYRMKWRKHYVKMYWEQMLNAVETIHNANIIHSDLKPANFLLVEGSLKLIDFGIAREIPNDTTNVHREYQTGTVNYMAPETILFAEKNQSCHRKEDNPYLKVGRASDVWSLGCILYQMIYGKAPFANLQLVQKLSCIVNPSYEIVFPSIYQEEERLLASLIGNNDQRNIDAVMDEEEKLLIQVMKSCLNRDPKKRATIEELLNHPYLSGKSTDLEKGCIPSLSLQKIESIVDELSCVPELNTQNLDLISKSIYKQLMDNQKIDLSQLELN